ncbi:hypothetical protein DD592_26205 [Enterobacter cloacae complex sp. 2DZ2F20B]|nr:hypothetical protein DD592_26205 [Enterobacter cloacae complex sp. 2DZ2F20B]
MRNFFFGDFFTTICIQTSYTNREALKQAIQQYCLQISTKMLINTRRSFEDRLTYCTAAESSVFEQFLKILQYFSRFVQYFIT